MNVKKFLEEQFPELRGKITGGHFPPPPIVPLLNNLVSALHMITIAIVFLGETFWSYVPFVRTAPSWYYSLKEYPIQTFMLIFFIIPSMVTSMATSGAFEITLDGNMLLWSRIATGKFPDGPELLKIFQKALK